MSTDDHRDTPRVSRPAGSSGLPGRLRDLEGLSDAWDRLALRYGSPIQRYAWACACALAFSTEEQLSVVVSGDPDPTAIAPLVVRRDPVLRLEMLGVHELYEPMDFLYGDTAALIPLAEALAASGQPLALRRIPAESALPGALARAYRGRGAVIRRAAIGCSTLPLDGTWSDPERNLGPRRRGDLRRARRIAEGMGSTRAEILSPAPAELGPLLDEAFRVEAASWKGAQGFDLLHDPLRAPFYRTHAAALCEEGLLRLAFLRIGSRAAAMQLAVEFGGRFSLLKVGYDQEFSRCSPGSLLVAETIRHAAARGLASYEFLGTVEPWTQFWTSQVRPCLSIWVYPYNVRGLMAFAGDAAGILRRRLGRGGRTTDGLRAR